MRINIEIELERNELPLDHRRIFLSLIKLGLTKLGGSETVGRWYGGAVQKPYTFSLFLPGAVFGETVTLSSPFVRMILSTNDYRCFGDMTNAMNRLRGIKVEVSGVRMSVIGITVGRETPVTGTEAEIKLLSPLVVRKHEPYAKHDRYVTADDADFESELRESVAAQLRMLGLNEGLASTLRLIDKSRARRTVTTHFDRCFSVTVGRLKIAGSRELLEILSLVGMGSLRSSGFGMFDVISQGGEIGG